MEINFEQVINGFHFTGLAEVEPGESATDISPSWPTIVTVFKLHLDGSPKDCIDIIDPAVIQRIEQMLVESV
jgi:hypothetical protein